MDDNDRTSLVGLIADVVDKWFEDGRAAVETEVVGAVIQFLEEREVFKVED